MGSIRDIPGRRDRCNRGIASLCAMLAALLGSTTTASAQDPIPKPDNKPAATPLSPAESLRRFKLPADLQITELLAEPTITQPLFLGFDERGRLWVVEYRQYPDPAGIKMVSKDQYWRAVYDRVPPPPPNHFPGLDRISIHADSNGDGTYDEHKVFVDGLNIATAVAWGRGGAWVLNPPYLLFYPDRDRDDAPDGDPEVHLEGFGLEDTHSVANSLTWGPDGWLYAAQGSTVTGNVRRPGFKDAEGRPEPAVHSLGQLIWRYHPETKRYEIFAEGGGNAFGVEIDAKGRIFSGHNGGDTRGFHYVQGGYSQKGFTKHGPLSNPYAFGFFPPMKHHTAPRFTHTFLIYEGDLLPAAYRGKLLGVAPILSHVVLSDVKPLGATWETRDLGYAVETSDAWFKPVDIKLGPDGALYVADWYDGQANHYRNHEGQIDRQNGRIYRVGPKDGKRPPLAPFDLGSKTTAELVELLKHANRWHRQTALRLLYDRRDSSVAPQLIAQLNAEDSSPQTALESFWALNACGAFDEALAERTLRHRDPHVRLWTVRLSGDPQAISPALAERLASLARGESNVEVRSQLASTARRLNSAAGLPILAALATHAEDATDPLLPLLIWWGLEKHCRPDPAPVLALFDAPELWRQPLAAEHLLPRLMKRFAQPGTRSDLLICARLLRQAPDDASRARLLQGFTEAVAGRPLADLPDELIAALPPDGPIGQLLAVRRGEPQAIEDAINQLHNHRLPVERRLELVQLASEFESILGVPTLLRTIERDPSDDVRQAALAALGRYDDPHIADELLRQYNAWPAEVQLAAQSVLASRADWTLAWLTAIEARPEARQTVPTHIVRRLQGSADTRVAALTQRLWPLTGNPTTAELQAEIDRIGELVRGGAGSPYAGQKLFAEHCGKCHALFAAGGKVGPDLTSFKRDDLANMLLAIVNPSAEIREGFETFTAVTDDGRIATGLMVDQDPQRVVLRGADGQNVSLARNELEELAAAKVSVMPEGLLKNLTAEQVCDLFAYLRSTQPLNN